MATLAQSQFTIRRLVDGKTMNFFLNSNHPATQIFTPDPSTYVPNYAASGQALVITPDLQISGESGNQTSKFKAGSVVWKINGTTITGTNATYGATASAAHPYTLTINKNMTADSQLNIECSAVYVQPITLQEIPVKQQIAFTKVSNSGASIIAVCTAPDGIIFKNGEIATLKARCDMWRGSTIDDTNVTYTWSINQSGSWVALTSSNAATYGITGYTTNQITIPSSAVLNYASFKCDVKDTDTSSSTYNKTVTDVISFTDLSDPYRLDVDLAKGDGVAPGMSITAKINIYQGATKMPDGFFTNKKARYFRFTAAGSLDSTWGTNSYKEGRDLTITESDLLDQYQTVFGAEVNG